MLLWNFKVYFWSFEDLQCLLIPLYFQTVIFIAGIFKNSTAYSKNNVDREIKSDCCWTSQVCFSVRCEAGFRQTRQGCCPSSGSSAGWRQHGRVSSLNWLWGKDLQFVSIIQPMFFDRSSKWLISITDGRWRRWVLQGRSWACWCISESRLLMQTCMITWDSVNILTLGEQRAIPSQIQQQGASHCSSSSESCE